ncbi:MAG TPA: hypothetical protein VE360_03995, partial [Pyrinomonadaceae bacterium]|nr:hypothetical protein [Pyrinomonadaceae bacterium]
AAASAQTPPQAKPATQQPAPPVRQAPPRPVAPQRLDLADYGIQIEPDARLIVVMAALDAAGWDPTPKGAAPTLFRAELRKDLAGLDPILRGRMKDFYERHKLRDAAATPADQVAPYVSLAYALGPAPSFETPARSDDLPSGVLDVLDFVTLVREFYRQSGMDGLLPKYVRSHRAAGDQLRGPATEMARSVLSYLNTRPVTEVEEKLSAEDPTKSADRKKRGESPRTVTRVRERRFIVTPDLLAPPGAINFRVIGEDYYAVTPVEIDLGPGDLRRVSGLLRRSYVQYMVDPLVLRFNRDVAAKRAEIKQVADAEAARQNRPPSPDIFLAVARSMVAAADARMDASARLRALRVETSNRLQAAKDEAARAAVLKESKELQQSVEDEATAGLAEAYERGAVLSFYFAEQLRDVEDSGFDIANFVPNMLTAIDPARESKRPAEYAAAVARHKEARRQAQQARATEAAAAAPDAGTSALLKSLNDVEDLLRLKNYEGAEARLAALKNEHREDPRVYFLLGQAASLSAQDAIDGELQERRLVAALGHFRQAVLFAASATDPAVVLRAHLERKDEAAKEFDAVISKTNPADRIHQEALNEKRKLGGQE